MTSREMLEERLNGKTYREIGEMCGISKQAVQDRINNLLNGRSYSKIIYRGVYEYFASKRGMNWHKITDEVNRDECLISRTTLTKFLRGETAHISINVIIRLCEIVGKSFEETFALMDDNHSDISQNEKENTHET